MVSFPDNKADISRHRNKSLTFSFRGEKQRYVLCVPGILNSIIPFPLQQLRQGWHKVVAIKWMLIWTKNKTIHTFEGPLLCQGGKSNVLDRTISFEKHSECPLPTKQIQICSENSETMHWHILPLWYQVHYKLYPLLYQQLLAIVWTKKS